MIRAARQGAGPALGLDTEFERGIRAAEQAEAVVPPHLDVPTPTRSVPTRRLPLAQRRLLGAFVEGAPGRRPWRRTAYVGVDARRVGVLTRCARRSSATPAP